jgi:hypothetical protein
MAGVHDDETIQKTEWTGTLLEDLCSALSGKREDDVVRAFARELMDDKNLPIEYLVRKVEDSLGQAEAERLDILIRGKYLVEKGKKAEAEQAKSEGGVFGFVKKLLG